MCIQDERPEGHPGVFPDGQNTVSGEFDVGVAVALHNPWGVGFVPSPMRQGFHLAQKEDLDLQAQIPRS